jgi:hypothetical protein
MVGIEVESGNDNAYFAGYNINRKGYDGVSPGFRDLSSDPLFIFPPGANGNCLTSDCDFHVQVASGGPTSPAIDRRPQHDPLLVAVLRDRTIPATTSRR